MISVVLFDEVFPLSHFKPLVSRGIKVSNWQLCEGIFGMCRISGGTEG